MAIKNTLLNYFLSRLSSKKRYYWHLEDNGKNNRFFIADETGALRPFHRAQPNWRICVDGNDNTVILPRAPKTYQASVLINGSGCRLQISATPYDLVQPRFVFWGDRHTMQVGPDLSCMDRLNCYLTGGNASIIIGKDCMFSLDVVLRAGDGHLTAAQDDASEANITLGDHVWVGERAFFLKKARVGAESIVGACAVVTKPYPQPRQILAGNPARVIKQGIRRWIR